MSEHTSKPERSADWSMVGAAAAALGASVCCVIPIFLVSVGITGAWISGLSALGSLKPYFVGGSLLLLGYAGYREYQLATRADCTCETVLSSQTRRVVLGVAALLILGVLGATLLVSAPASTTASVHQGGAAGQTGALKEVVLEVEGMTCSGCTTTVKSSLQQVDGAQEVTVTYQPPEARVIYDPSAVTPRELAQASAEVGYPAKIKRSSSVSQAPAD